MAEWKYKFLYLRGDKIEAELNKWAKHRWEVCGMSHVGLFGNNWGIILRQALRSQLSQ
jgi:hypothetical protein